MDFTTNSKCNESILELTQEDLQAELLKCRSLWKDHQQIIENRTQEVHVLKRQMVSLEFENQQYQQELEHIASIELQKFKTLQDRIQELETTLIRRNSCSSDSGEVERLQSECEIHRKTITELEVKLKEDTALRSVNKLEFYDLTEQNEALKAKYEFAYSRYASVLQELQEVNGQVKTLNEELEEARNTYVSNSADTKAKLEEQEDQIAFLRADLLNAQSAQQQNKDDEQHEARGNSMFSEVYDNWIRLKGNNETLVLAYQEARKERNKLRNEAAMLRRENMSMCERWKTEGIEARQKDSDLINTYKYANDNLEVLVKKYEDELAKERNAIYSTNDVTVYMNMIKSKNEQIEKLYKDFRGANGHTIMHHMEVREVNNKARKYMTEATQYKNELELLKKELDQLKESEASAGNTDHDENTNSNNSKCGTDKLAGSKNIKPVLRDVGTMTERERLRPQPQSRTDYVKQCRLEKSSSTNDVINLSEPSVDEGRQPGEDCGKENDLAMSNIVGACKTDGRKVTFAESVPDSSFVNQKTRKPRPRGRPMDCSQMIVIKRAAPKKL